MHEITIERVFSAAHALRLPDGSLEPVHGHNWDVAVTVGAEKLDEMAVVMDFHELERSVDRLVAELHNGDLNRIEPFASGVNPSAERVASHFAERVSAELPAHVRLRSVSVGEAPGCTATYRPD